MLMLLEQDFAELRAKPTLRAKMERLILQPTTSRSVEMETRVSVYHPSSGARIAHEVTESVTDHEALRSGRLVIGFYPFTSRKPKMVNAMLTLTDDARARVNVWLDSMIERGLIKE